MPASGATGPSTFEPVDDQQEAARAARQRLISDAYAEQLWRSLMRAEYEAGNMSRVHEAWKACLKAVAEVSADGDPHPDTVALYRRLSVGGRTA